MNGKHEDDFMKNAERTYVQRSELGKSLDEFRNNMSEMIEYFQLRAKVQKAHYDALLKEGFSAEDARYIAAKK